MAGHFDLRQFADDRTLATTAANDWLALLRKSAGPYAAAISGGRITKTFFAALASQPDAGKTLSQVQFFFADERCVPPESPDSNFRLAQENLFTPLSIPTVKIFRLKGEWLPMAAVSEAISDLRRTVRKDGNGVPVLDMILLGMGEDGHTASLMPNAPPSVAECREPYAHVPNSPKPPPDRITLTYPVLAAAREVWMLAAGADKQKALRDSLEPNGITPFARVLQSRPRTVIYTDLNEMAATRSK